MYVVYIREPRRFLTTHSDVQPVVQRFLRGFSQAIRSYLWNFH